MENKENLNVSGVYVITNILNNKQYVGQSKNIKRRWQDHSSKSIHPRKQDEYNSLLYRAMREDGLENFTIKVLEECSIENLKEREVYWIEKLNTYNDGYNNSFGGDLPCETYEHHLTDHGRSVFTIGEVRMCRQAYKEGKKSRDMYESFFKDRITYSGFLQMWHGKNWKEIMPEVFEKNPRPSQKVTLEDIEDIRRRFDSGQGCRSIANDYKGKLSYTTIHGIANRNTYKDNIHYKSDVSTIPLVGK